MKTIFLCGFMGCGKTTAGKLLSDETGRVFVDMDAYIEDYEHRTIAEIFASDGEAYFRQLEREAVERLAPSGFIVATGGGAMVDPVNAEAAKKGGEVVLIDTPFELCYERIKGDRKRPLAAGSTREELLARYEARMGKYLAAADRKVDGSGTPREICALISAGTVGE
ncbi:MAG: shikimate kinase [Ruminococcus sp.]|nr:shikimate kinase [Ruminococcus sp.]